MTIFTKIFSVGAKILQWSHTPPAATISSLLGPRH
jgi:hypothetical protein